MKIAAIATAGALLLATPASALTTRRAADAVDTYASGLRAQSYDVQACHRRSVRAITCVVRYAGVPFGGYSDWSLTERVWVVQRSTGLFVDSSMFGPFGPY